MLKVKNIGEAVRIANMLCYSVQAGPSVNAWGQEVYVVEKPTIPYKYVYCSKEGWLK